MSIRDKLILTGLYLSKFNEEALNELGFKNYQEAFNVLGLSLASKPSSIKITETSLIHCSQIIERVGIRDQLEIIVSSFIASFKILILKISLT